jgi:multidrug efflux pump subunit AcrA (membrane-fusion protein)
MKSTGPVHLPLWITALLLLMATTVVGGDAQGVSVAVAQPTQSDLITTTGRVIALHTARVGARLSAHIVEWGKAENGQPLEVGFPVKAGQLLFRLQADTFADRVHVGEVVLKLAESQLADLKAWTREERREALRATVQEIDARMTERKRDEDRFRRLVEEDKTMPVKRLEEIQLQIQVLEAQRRGAQAQLSEAERGPTPTQLAVADAQVDQARAHLESAKLDLRDTVVLAPFSGVISRRFKTVGDYVTNAPFTEVLELTSQEDLEAELRLPEKFYRRIVPGQTQVLLRSPLLATELKLPVARVIPEVDAVQSTFGFRMAIPPASRGQLAPGAFLMGVIALSGSSESAVVPAEGVRTRDGRPVVFVAQDGKMRRRDVEVGDRLSEGVVIDRGLKPGERVLMGLDSELIDGRDLPAHLTPELKPAGERAAP